MNCNGSVKPDFISGVQIFTKIDSATFCTCGIPWLSYENSHCERCGSLVSEERRELLKDSETSLNVDLHVNEQENPQPLISSVPKESDWTGLLLVVLSGIAIFGFLYNIYREPVDEEFLVQVINMALLAYTNFLAYPLLLFVVFGSTKRFPLVSVETRSYILWLFFASPFAVVAFQLIGRILERLW